MSVDARRAFLVGEGTLTVAEVFAWAQELGEPVYSPPEGTDSGAVLMVAVRDALSRTGHEKEM